MPTPLSPSLDRRTFLTLFGGAVTALTAGARGAADARPEPPLLINALGGIEDPNVPTTEASGSNPVAPSDAATITARALADLRAAGLTAVNITLGYVAGAMDPYPFTRDEIRHWDAVIARHPDALLKVTTAADIERARREHKTGLIFGFQNAAQLGDRVDRVDEFARLGVRVIQLTYNPRNALGDGSSVAENRGLTPFGREVVARLNARRVMVDLSHSGENTCLDAARCSTQPISINHTGCRALADLPRNKTDAELRLVAERGGFVGIYFMPFLRLDGPPRALDVVVHLEHAINVCGEDHVGIGTDGGITAIDDFAAYRAQIVRDNAARKQAGISAAGEGPTVLPLVEELCGVDQFRRLAGLLAARGHSEVRIAKILGGNFLRFARDVWGA